MITPLIARATTKPIMLNTMGSSQTKNSFVMTGKTFYGQPLLKRHQRHGMCTTLKNFICQICVPTKWFKSHLSLVIHIKRFHTGWIPLVPCPKCKKEFASKESLKAYNIIHLGLELLKKQKGVGLGWSRT